MDGFFHFDFLLLTARGILVLDLRDIAGTSSAATRWTSGR